MATSNKDIIKSVQKCIKYINDNIDRAIGLDDILMQADTFCTGRIEKHFSDATGVTPYRYLKSLRLNRVLRLLKDTDIDVEDIAEQAMYKDRQSLYTSFRNEFGFSLMDFRSYCVLNSTVMKEYNDGIYNKLAFKEPDEEILTKNLGLARRR